MVREVSVQKLWNLATAPGQKRMSYGMYWALNKMVQRGTRARYEMGYHVTFCQWFSNREAAFILPRLEGGERTNRGREFSAWIGGVPVTVIYRTGMLNGNIRVDVEWIDRDMQEQILTEEEATKAARKEICDYIFSSLRSNVSEEEIQATVLERYGIEDMDKFLLNSKYPITKKQVA